MGIPRSVLQLGMGMGVVVVLMQGSLYLAHSFPDQSG